MEYLILILLVLLNAFFAASELAIVSTRKTRIKQLADEGRRGARSVMRLSDNPSRFLATIQLWVTLAGFFTSAYGAVSLSNSLAETLKQIEFLRPAADTLAFILVTVLVALFSLIFGELVPKTLAVEAAESIALAVARPIEWLARVGAPIIAFLTAITNVVVRLFGSRRRSGISTVTQEEVVSMVTAGQEEGIFHAQQEEMIRSVFDFSEKRVREVMRPRPDIFMLEAQQPLNQAAATSAESDYSRYPIYSGDRENITGVVYAKDVLRCFAKGRTNTTVGEIARPPVFVPESKQVSELFTELQTSHTHLAVVIDEYGGVAGMVTLEDLLEEIVGEIQDEFDHEENILTPDGANQYIVNGRVSLFDLNQELDLNLGRDPNGVKLDVDTLGGFLMAELKRIPVTGDVFRHEFAGQENNEDEGEYPTSSPSKVRPLAVSLEVLEMDGRRVGKVRLVLEYLEETDGEDLETTKA